MSLEPLFSGLHDVDLDYHRRRIAIAADRAQRFAAILLDLIEMREDDRAQSMRGALAEQTAEINKAFSDLGAAINALPAKLAAKHFSEIGSRPSKTEVA